MTTVRSILIVDDNPADVFLARTILERTGRFTHFLTASDGREAIQMYQNYEASRARHPEAFPPLVILLDINMPIMTGFDFLDGFAELPIPGNDPSVVVMLTSSEYSPDRERAANYPLVQEYIVKPLSKDEANRIADRFGT